MILADTSVWIEHLRRSDPKLDEFLGRNAVLAHPFVIGELACGNLSRRDEMLSSLADLPQSVVASDGEVLALIDRHRLMGRGLGYLDAHLLASTLLTSGASLWTLDRRLADVARSLGAALPLTH